MGLFPTTKKFINRQVEIKVAEDFLNRLATAQSAAVEGIVFYGPPGIGKSRLLQDISGRCRHLTLLPSAINFQRQKINSHRQYLFQLWAQLEKPPARKKLRETLKNSSAEEALSLFAQRLQQYLKGLPFILLLDSCELCHSPLFDWIGQIFLSHLENTLLRPIGLFLASRGHQVETSNWPVQYVKSIQSRYVAAFDLAGTTEHLAAINRKKKSRGEEKPIYHLSVGHPLSTEALVLFLRRLAVKVETLPQNRPQLAQQLYDEVLQKYLLPPVDSWPRDNFEILCIPRRFDAAILEKLDVQYSFPWYSARMQEMQKANIHLIHVDRGEPAYQLDVTLRKLLHAALSILRLERVLEINRKLLQFHESELRQEASIGRPRANSLLEMFYHYIQVTLLSGQAVEATAENWLRGQLQIYFNPEQSDDILQLKLLRDLLDQDTDFVELLGRPLLEQLLANIKDFSSFSPSRETFHLSIKKNPPAAEYQVIWFFENSGLSPELTVRSEIEYSISEWQSDPEMCGRMAAVAYLPPEVKDILAQNRRFVIELTTNTMDIPFELMHDGQEFLCLAHPISRRIETMKTGRTVAPLPAIERRALVVGDPTGNLSSAKEEAEAVAAMLKLHHFEVKLLIGRDQANLKNFARAIALEKYHLIHYAGHAFFDSEHPTLSGLCLAKDNEVAKVTAGELKRYLNYPAFVFFNACEAAAAEKEATIINDQGSLIENLAVAALEGGACGCLGSMWKIADPTAKDFALAFYEFLFLNKPIGEAVQLARKHIRQSSIDWAAWVLFGNPHMHPLGAAPK